MICRRVENNEDWSLFCPNEAPGLAEVWGEEFDKLYEHYEREGRAKKVVRAQQLWFAILEGQIETGNPYMLFKDSCNRKSNQQNLGTIKCSNLCTEIIEYTSPQETAVCNLASIALPRFVREKNATVSTHTCLKPWESGIAPMGQGASTLLSTSCETQDTKEGALQDICHCFGQ